MFDIIEKPKEIQQKEKGGGRSFLYGKAMENHAKVGECIRQLPFGVVKSWPFIIRRFNSLPSSRFSF